MDFVARIIVLLFWCVWLVVAFGPALLFAKRVSDREVARRRSLRHRGLPVEPKPMPTGALQAVVGIMLAVGGFFLAYAMLGDPEVQSVIIYRRIVG